MCCLFGLIDYKNILSAKQKEKFIKVLSAECEARGTDATGIAYLENGRMKIYKKPLPAHKMKFKFYNNPTVIMGHTRLTTQGNEKFNQNNHPFMSEKLGFALAHNGVLYNDISLRSYENLPVTNIETDSYIAVQLIDKSGTLDFKSVATMAEKVKGSFCFTILSRSNELYIVKGDNPMCIAKIGDIYAYASTEAILIKALRKLKISNYELYELSCGDIVRFENYGKFSMDKFDFDDWHLWERPHWGRGSKTKNKGDGKKSSDDTAEETYFLDYGGSLADYEREYFEDLVWYAGTLGVDEEVITELLDSGYDFVDVEDMLYNIDMGGDFDYCMEI